VALAAAAAWTLAACGASAAEPAAPVPRPVAVPAAAAPVRLLQMNLCNSGVAGCYTGGRAVRVAADVVRAERPDVVTLNEVCDADVPVLERALAEVAPGARVVSAFQPHRDGRTGGPYRCRNGQRFGLGLVSRWPTVPGSAAEGGIYPTQDRQAPEYPEERAWLCADVADGPGVSICTTHLAYARREIASAQCRHLFGTVVTGLRARDGALPLITAGDLNLGADSPELKACLPPGSGLVDDGGVQRVVATAELAVDASREIDMRGTTDHPALLVTLSRAAG
jgi:endonuclease/exonuclease/phosphatase family metal-dependent hydrolase